MSQTGFIYHDKFLRHETGSGHPERPERLGHLMQYLNKTDIYAELKNVTAQPGEMDWIEQIHPKAYIENIQAACGPGLQYLDSDTAISEESFSAALFAVGGVVEACHAVMREEIDNAFCAVRPPGHHAEPDRAMGFCLFNNVAVAAKYLINYHPIEKICIIDWDVHHGNGTQRAFYDDPTVFYVSIHQHPLYPGTGRPDEKGKGMGEGTNLNIVSPPGYGDKEYIDIFENQILPAVLKFKPDFVLISAGFDAHRDDPLANMEVTEAGFGQMTQLVKIMAEECCGGRVVSLLEGGYNLDALARSVEVHLEKLHN